MKSEAPWVVLGGEMLGALANTENGFGEKKMQSTNRVDYGVQPQGSLGPYPLKNI